MDKVQWRHLPRFYLPIINYENSLDYFLPEKTFKHAIQVRRLKVGDFFIAFDGSQQEYLSVIDSIQKHSAKAKWIDKNIISRGALRECHLVMSIIASEKMDWIIQKATELGVKSIQPVLTQYAFRIAKDRWASKVQHWREIMISACEQSGRNTLPDLFNIQNFSERATFKHHDGWYGVGSPHAAESLRQTLAPIPSEKSCSIWIGSEGGLSAEEETLLHQEGWKRVGLGERILRAETAALSALSLLIL